MLDNSNIISQFVAQTGFPYSSIQDKEYIIANTCTLAQAGLSLNQQQLDELCINFAQTIDLATVEIASSEVSLLAELCYPIELIKLLKTPTSELSYMRLGFVVDMSGVPKLIEVNSQTPSFNFELETGTDELIRLLHKHPRNPKYLGNLTKSLQDNLEQCALSIDKPLKDCSIGLLTCDSIEDIYQMNYLKRLIDDLYLVSTTEVLTNLTFDFDKQTGKPYNSGTETTIDILFNWYPLEFTTTNPYPDGSYFYTLLQQAMQSKQVAVYNGNSFIAQNKYLLVYMQEHNLVPNNLEQYWTPSFYTQTELAANNIENFIAKPIWGRQGSGIFGQEANFDSIHNFNGDMSDEYYNTQYYVYQQLWNSYPIMRSDTINNATLEKFVYKTKDGWQAGGQGLRISEDKIINNDSTWLILE